MHVLPSDVVSLERYLAGRLPDFSTPIAIRQFRGGQSNPTYHLNAAGKDYVLRQKPAGVLLPSAHAIEREHRVLSALQHSGVPVPRTYLLCEDPRVIGTPFYVMDYIAGEVMTDPALPNRSAADRHAVYESMAAVLARLHSVDWRAAGLLDFGRPGNYIAR